MKSSHDFVSLLETWLKRRAKSTGVRRVSTSNIALSTDQGSVRVENQDRAVVARFTNKDSISRIICIVADGMGGMESGLDCAAKAVSSFLGGCLKGIDTPVKKMLHDAVLMADKYVHQVHEGRGGATLSAICLVEAGEIHAVNVGDSRIYGILDKNLIQLSKDDTLEGQFGNDGNLFLGRNELIQYVGMGCGIIPNSFTFPQESDGWLISTDGVHFMASNILEKITQNSSDSGTAAFRLTEMSQWLGGNDNATCIVQLWREKNWDFFRGDVAGLLEVWDSFGDLQLFIGDSATKGDMILGDDISSCNSAKAPSHETKASHKDEKPVINESKKTSSSYKKNKLQEEAFEEDDRKDISQKSKPQLKMKFDESKDG